MSYTISPINASTKTIAQEELKKIKKEEEVEIFGANKTENNEDVQEEITFEEGAKLFGQGALDKIKEMASGFVKHPIKTGLAMAGTTAAIAALPLIGISSATGAAALAVGFGAVSIFKAGKDVKETIDDYQEGKFDEVREDLKDLGGDGVDLAMSLPFMPKAIKQLARTAKYGTSTIGLNSSLISDLKNANCADDVAVAFGKANTKINYEMIGRELGHSVKPELVFDESLPSPEEFSLKEYCNKGIDGFKKTHNKTKSVSESIVNAGESMLSYLEDVKLSYNNKMMGKFDPVSGQMYINPNYYKTQNKIAMTIAGKNKFCSPEAVLTHELKHFQQFADVARVYTPQGVQECMTKQYQEIVAKNMGTNMPLNEKINLPNEIKNTQGTIDTTRRSLSDINFDIADESGKYLGALEEYTEQLKAYNASCDPNKKFPEFPDTTKLESLRKKKEVIMGTLEGQKSELKKYTELYEHFNEHVLKNNTIDPEQFWNMTSGDKSAFNQTFWDDVVSSQSSVATSADDIARVKQYQEAMLAKADTNNPYAQNLLEAEAFKAQNEYVAKHANTPGLLADNLMALGLAQETFCEDDMTLSELFKSTIEGKSLNEAKNAFISPALKNVIEILKGKYQKGLN